MSEKIIITFPDGNKKEVDKGINGLELASQISKSLAKESVAIKINNEIKDISLPINVDASVAILKRDSEEALELIRHDCAHVMAEAVQELFPGTQVTIGPAIENGFYYDFARDEPFTVADLPKIEKKMHDIIQRNKTFIREVWSKEETIKYFKDKLSEINGVQEPNIDIKNDNLYTYNWPGNVRELRNLVERITILSANETQENINKLKN